MKRINILVTSAGRRLQLIECFREALRDNCVAGSVYAADCSPYAPAFHLADNSWRLPRCSDPSFIRELLTLAERERVDIIVPTIDSELGVLAENRDLFARRGIHVSVSHHQTVLISGDKMLTHDWLKAHGFPTVSQWRPEDILCGAARPEYPVIAKPRRGSASAGVRHVQSREELRCCAAVEDELIVQTIAGGWECTINVFVDCNGACLCAVPHQRLEVRGGEVSKGLTLKHRPLMSLARDIAEALPGAHGPLNIQCFLTPTDEVTVIEVNARFGGGYPLAHRAGARFTHWIVQEALGSKPSAGFDDWTDDLLMLRYDDAVFMPASDVRAASGNPKVLSGIEF
jgi:carbamoyl-phosphate synthase large subunit